MGQVARLNDTLTVFGEAQVIYDLWDVYQQGQIASATDTAESAKRDATHTDARLHQEVLRLESKIDGLALICQALVEILRDSGGVSEAAMEAKMKEIDDRDGRSDGRIAGHPTECPSCHRPAHTRQRVCMYCSAPIPGGMLVQRPLTARSNRLRGKAPAG
jgi:hypothetical protein